MTLDKLYSLADPPALPRVVFRKLLEFATKKSHFFDGKYYGQIDGVAMGSPLGPVLDLANILTCDFEEKWKTVDMCGTLSRGLHIWCLGSRSLGPASRNKKYRNNKYYFHSHSFIFYVLFNRLCCLWGDSRRPIYDEKPGLCTAASETRAQLRLEVELTIEWSAVKTFRILQNS